VEASELTAARRPRDRRVTGRWTCADRGERARHRFPGTLPRAERRATPGRTSG